MIFVTVGTQGSFDRLVRTVDDWAGQSGRRDLLAQIGPSDYRPKHFEAKQFLHPDEIRENVEAAELVVAHAGMGSIITALEYGKRVIVMPRHCDLREHRNDHQIATAKRLSELGLVEAVFDEAALHHALDRLPGAVSADRLSATASPQLISVLRKFVENPDHTHRHNGKAGVGRRPAADVEPSVCHSKLASCSFNGNSINSRSQSNLNLILKEARSCSVFTFLIAISNRLLSIITQID
ncbi:hypothetical protein HCU64_20920 [Methylobacterium sp. C25]|uniref:glycosyltransferase n=1 Tax=Methylobacterium sp. C25 TaxID=2721622 RepID=UPI001F35C796|nr:glycosyltransferase [Methylobacterium sp. C25]MCE4226217.1 hypothetical protein [Methylobacterium sp. C25]